MENSKDFFSGWTEDEKEKLLFYLEKKFFLIKKTTVKQYAVGALAAALFFVGGAGGLRAYIDSTVQDEMKSLIASGARQELAQLQQQAHDDVASIDVVSNQAKQTASEMEAMKSSMAAGNLSINNLSVQSLKVIDGEGHTKISLYTNGTDTPNIDLLSDDNVPLVRLGGNAVEGNGLFVWNNKGSERLSVSLQTCQCAQIDVKDDKGNDRLILDVSGDSDISKAGSSLFIENSEGKVISDDYEDDDSHGGAFDLSDKSGNVIASLPPSSGQ